ncbi:MAG: nucleotidyltransferase domain-containing protein [Desulfurococcales archaeon]|nr:nucleotidyltransferase domain-containing protein [Desulfurococcales archaeon]
MREARRRAEVFRNLDRYLARMVEVVKGLDPGAEVYLFGSVAEGRSTLSSDIDVLVVTDRSPGEVLAALWAAGIRDPFEVHVADRRLARLYRGRARLVRVA